MANGPSFAWEQMKVKQMCEAVVSFEVLLVDRESMFFCKLAQSELNNVHGGHYRFS